MEYFTNEYLEDITETHYRLDEYSDPDLDRLFKEAYDREYAEKYAHIQRIEEIKNKTKYIFLSINPDTANITLPEFVRCMEKMMSKAWLTNYLYVFEQRGETLADCGKGYHFHAIIEKPKNKSYVHIVRELSSTANKVCDSSNYHYFNLENISDAEKDRKIVYITGRKADPSKWAKQDMDIPFRINNNLKSCYNVGII